MVADHTFVDLPPAEVTVLEDRAQVVRRGTVSLAAGRGELRVAGAAPVLADKTLAVRVESGAGVRVHDVRCERKRVVLEADKREDVRALDQKIREIDDERAQAAAAHAVLDARQVALGKLFGLTLAEIGEDTRHGREDRARWSADLDGVQVELHSVRERLLVLKVRDEELAEQRADLQKRRDAADNPATDFGAEIVIDLEASTAGRVLLAVDYVVPGACWRPYHTARMTSGKVELRTDACIWQNTGEDWRDVRVFVSTERPSLGASAPLLDTDILHARKKGPEVNVEAREEKIHTTGLGAGPQAVTVQDMPGIEDRGDPVRLEARAKASVPSDGRPYRTPLFSFESAAKPELVVMAELSPCVFVKTRLVNASPRPLLPGPVDLVKNSGFAGRTSIKYVAPGERFELGWGPDPSLRVARQHEHLDEESKVLSSWVTTPHRVSVHLSNIGPEPRLMEVLERIPVSEVEKVKITLDPKHTSPGASEPDADGFVRWTVDLTAFARRSVRIAYAVKKHPDVVGI